MLYWGLLMQEKQVRYKIVPPTADVRIWPPLSGGGGDAIVVDIRLGRRDVIRLQSSRAAMQAALSSACVTGVAGVMVHCAMVHCATLKELHQD